MKGKGMYTILLAVIAGLTLSLAVLAFVLFMTWGSNNVDDPQGKIVQQDVPEEQMEIISLFDEEKYYNLKATPQNPEAIALLEVKLKCDAGKKKKSLEDITIMIKETYSSELTEVVSEYFQKMTYDEVIVPETRTVAKEVLKNKFNEILNKATEEKSEIVQQVIFEKWFYQK